MPCEVSWEEKGIYQKVSGIITSNEHQGVIDDVIRDERFVSTTYWLWDAIDVQQFVMTEDDVLLPIATGLGAANFVGKMNVALVCNKDEVLHLCQIYQDSMRAHNSPWQIEIFEDLEEARYWISRNS